MNGTINQRFRQHLLIKFLEDAKTGGSDIHNIYLVFSEEEERTGQDTSNSSSATISSVHNATTITAKFATKLSADELYYAVKATSGEDGISIDGTTYRIATTITDLTRLWTSVYFNINVKQASSVPLNIVTVLINLKSDASTYFTATTLNETTLATAVWDEAEIVMQARPALDDLQNEKYIQFPGLITF